MEVVHEDGKPPPRSQVLKARITTRVTYRSYDPTFERPCTAPRRSAPILPSLQPVGPEPHALLTRKIAAGMFFGSGICSHA